MDIQRYLNNEPVLAHAPARMYCLQKFLRRHRTETVGALAFLVFVAAVIVALYMWTQSQHHRADLESSRQAGLLSEAREACAKGDPNEALAIIEPILNSRHVGPEARLLHAQLVLDLRGPTAAVQELEALLSEPDEIAGQAHFLLARIYHDNDPDARGRTGEYRQRYEYHRQEAARLLPKSADAYLLKAMSAGTVRQTLDLLDQALERDGQHYDSLQERAFLSWVGRDFVRVVKDTSQMIVIRPDRGLGYSLRAMAQRELERYEDALEDHNEAIRLSPNEAEFYDQRRRTYLQMERYEDALKDARTCVDLNPGKTTYHFDVFCDLTALGNYDQARIEHNKIITSGIPRWHLGASAAKHVFDSLHAGRAWHPLGSPPAGHHFWNMLEAADQYPRWAAKAQPAGIRALSCDWSPDGNELVYSCGVEGKSGVAIWNRQTGKTRLLTMPGKDPVWSPDGQTIAYVRDRQVLPVHGIATTHQGRPRNEALQEIWLIKANGKEDPKFLVRGGWPQWSRYSNRIFFRSAPRSVGKMYSICPDGTDVESLMISYSDYYPVISPDDRYAACRQLNYVQVREISSGQLVAEWLAPLGVVTSSLSWSPDGQALSIGIWSAGSVSQGLWVYDLDRNAVSKVLSGPCRHSSWSGTDTGQIAIVRRCGSMPSEIWTAPTARVGSGQTVEAHVQDAIKLCTERIDAEPKYAPSYVSRAALHIYHNDEEKAFADLNQYESLVEDSLEKAQTYYDLGWRLSHAPQQRVDPSIVVRLHDRAHMLNPEHPWMRGTLGIAYYRAGRWQDAIDAIVRTIEIRDDGRLDYYAFFPAMAYWQTGDRERAQTWYRRAIAWMCRDEDHVSYMIPAYGYYMEAAGLMGLAVKFLDRKAPATGRQILPITVRADSSDPSGTAMHCADGTGLTDDDEDGLLEHSEEPEHMWLSQRGRTQGWLEFDLGHEHELGSILVWNYNERGHTHRGIRLADISVWTAESGWQTILDDVVFAEAEGSFDYDEPTHIELNGVRAQRIRLDDLSNFADEAYIGLSEVQFFQKRDEDPQSTAKTLRTEKQYAVAGFVFGEPVNLGPAVNSEATDWAPRLSADGLELYFHSHRLGGPSDGRIWVTTRDTTDSEWWSTPLPLNTGLPGAGTPSISADGLTLFFSSNQPEGSGNLDLWMTARETPEDDWGTPKNLGSNINSSGDENAPCISSDGLELYFTSNRDDWKTWVTKRATKDEPWGTAVSLGPIIHNDGSAMHASISTDGLMLFFTSWRAGGCGKADVWVTRRATTNSPWTEPENLGAIVNSSRMEFAPCLSPDGSTLYFSSDRAGGFGTWDLWQVPILSAPGDLEEDGDSASDTEVGGSSKSKGGGAQGNEQHN